MSDTNVRFCKDCGSKNPMESKFCNGCGKPLNGSPQQKMPTEQKVGHAQGIVSLVLSILGFSCLPFLGSIAAVITGFLTPERNTNNFAKAGIIIGFVGIGLGVLGGLIGLLIGIWAMIA